MTLFLHSLGAGDLAVNGQSRPEGVANISGRVVTQDGKPLERATVVLNSLPPATTYRNTVTDADGRFSFNRLPATVYMISASTPAYIPDRSRTTEQVRVGDEVTISLIRGGVITGRVTGLNDEPIIGVAVSAQLVSEPEARSGGRPLGLMGSPTDDRGIYRIYGLPPGSYRVAANAGAQLPRMAGNAYESTIPTYHPSSNADGAAEVNVQAGAEVSSIDIQFRETRGHSISGVVEIAGTPAAVENPMGVMVMLLNAGGTTGRILNARQGSTAKSFSVNGVPDGEYDVIAQAVGFSLSQEWFTSAPKRVVVRGSDISGLKLIASARATISGTVTVESVDGKPLSCRSNRDSRVTEMTLAGVRDEKARDGDLVDALFGRLSTTVNDKAGFSLTNVMAGRYRLVPSFPSDAWYVKTATMPGKPGPGRTDLSRAPIVAAAGDKVSDVVLTLSDGAAAVEGKLGSARSKSGNWVVHLVPAETKTSDDLLRYYEVAADRDGSFALSNIAPGKYWIVARAAAVNEPIEFGTAFPIAWNATERAKLRREAEAGKKEMTLKVCDRIKGFVLD